MLHGHLVRRSEISYVTLGMTGTYYSRIGGWTVRRSGIRRSGVRNFVKCTIMFLICNELYTPHAKSHSSHKSHLSHKIQLTTNDQRLTTQMMFHAKGKAVSVHKDIIDSKGLSGANLRFVAICGDDVPQCGRSVVSRWDLANDQRLKTND